jgi:hypothetical protein
VATVCPVVYSLDQAPSIRSSSSSNNSWRWSPWEYPVASLPTSYRCCRLVFKNMVFCAWRGHIWRLCLQGRAT